ncbi:MAG: hypothetical protein ACREJF_08355, partial [Candidatus Methylomirabilales bacterium]
LALLSGSAQEARPIGSEIVTECARALGLLTTGRERDREREEAFRDVGQGPPADPSDRERAGGLQKAHWTARRKRVLQAAFTIPLLALLASLGVYVAGPGRAAKTPPDSGPKDTRDASRGEAPPELLVEKTLPSGASLRPREAQRPRRAEEGPPAPPSGAGTAGGGARPEGASQERKQRLDPKPASAFWDKEKSETPRAGAPAPARDEAAGEDPESPDPAGIIDWVLKEHAAKRQ